MRRLLKPVLGSLLTAAALSACGPTPAAGDDNSSDSKDDGIPSDVSYALGQLGPEAHVIAYTYDGLPTFIIGEMARVNVAQTDDATAAQASIAPALPKLLAPFRLQMADLSLRKINTDEEGGRHFRYNQKFNGLDVVGGDLIVHVDVKGAVHAINGSARGDISPSLGRSNMSADTARSVVLADARFAGMTISGTREVYIQTDDGKLHKAIEAIVSGTTQGIRGTLPLVDKVYVDVDSSSIVADYPTIHSAESRKVYTAAGSTTTPGTLVRSEGQAASSDTDVNSAYDGTGDAYEGYKAFFNRDSYNNAGAVLISTVHYNQNYCNAFWNGTQMVYGDGDASQGCLPLARSVDVTAHELTHAVTENESGLNYSGESGGMNESMSDIFGAFVESWTNGGKNGSLPVSNDKTWTVGEDILPPGLRFMYDPAKDGNSADVYSSTVGNLDVHYSSGVSNLAFYLLSQGGVHPRGKTTINVPGIGLEKAIRILYKAQTDYITSTSNYAAVRTAMETATTALGYDSATKDSVSCAWAAVKVGAAPASCGGTGGGGGGSTDGTLTSGTPVTGISDVVGGQKFWKLTVPANSASVTFTTAGGTGDADLYVQAGAKPTTTTYTCRPYITGNNETCTITNPAAGDYWVLLNAYAAYSGLTLTGTVTAGGGGGGGGGDPLLTNGTAINGVAGAASSTQYWRINTPAGKTLTVKLSGGTGDADLYTRFASRPTTSTYACRPYVTGNNETCTQTATQAGDYYILVRGYAAFTGASLIATY